MKENIKIILILALFALGCYLLGFFKGKGHCREVTKMVTDTLTIVDTQVIEKPELEERTSKDPLLVPVHDTVRIKDTIYISLPMESKTYKGEGYMAVVSGYKPSLDRIEVYPKTTTISKTETVVQRVTKRHGLALGMEANYFGNTYVPIPIYLEYTNMLHKNIGMYGRISYDLLTQSYGVGLGVKVSFGW